MDYVIVGLLCAGALLLIAGVALTERRERERQRNRLVAIERKLDGILDHLGLDHERPDLSRVEELLSQGRTVAAVKAYRETTGAGLVEAKAEIDRLSERR